MERNIQFKLISINLKEIEPLLAFKRESLDLITNLIRERNVLVHTGEFALDRKSLIKQKFIVSDILYLLDSFLFFKRFRTEFYISENRLISEMENSIDPNESLGNMGIGAEQSIRFDMK